MISMKNYLILIGWRWEKLASRKMFRHFLYTNFLMFIIYKWSYNFPHSIGQVRYINIQAWLRGFRVKIANFSSLFCPSIPIRELDTKETTPNIEVWPECLGAMLEYWYIERGLFGSGSCNFSFLKNLLTCVSKLEIELQNVWLPQYKYSCLLNYSINEWQLHEKKIEFLMSTS